MTIPKGTRVAFWISICVSCVFLLLAITFSLRVTQAFFGEGPVAQHGAPEIVIVVLFVLQPLLVLFLIVRAVALRNTGQSLRVVTRALYPSIVVITATLLMIYGNVVQYLYYQSELRKFARWDRGSITYVCSSHSEMADYNPKTIGPIELKLTEKRYLGKLGNWVVRWSHKAPIKAASFPSRTGSYGGSQGIAWQEPDGRHMIAYISFSDVMNDRGPETIWVTVEQGDVPLREKYSLSPNFTCGPDPASYHE